MPDFFTNSELSLRTLTGPNTGFRPGQLGALYSVLSHFSVYEEPATVSLPTGYGKTAVIMALPFLLRAERVLVVEPSDALRRQTTSHFKALSTLRKLSVVAGDLSNPKVHGQKGMPASMAEWEAMREYDVVVSTPQSTSPHVAPGAPENLFDLIIFDEAHHAPADSWSAYLDHFEDARFVFLTATPFRRDRKTIPGRIAYWYPVLKASKENAFGRVRFTNAPVANELNDEEVDRSVAETAAKQLLADRKAGFDHRIFARAASIPAAKALVSVYEAAGVKVAAIASHISKRTQDDVEQSLIDGTLDGIVCVDMFGEGYDFPKLKIAALHAPHRSLVPTLQFVGRFARTNDAATGDATLIAPVSRLRESTKQLLEEGVDIAELIDAAAQEEIGHATDQEILNVLKITRQAESDYDAVTPLSLELYAHTQIFDCEAPPDFDLIASTISRALKLAKQWTSDDGRLTLLLTVDHSPPNWATSNSLANVRHDAFLLAYNAVTKYCFIGSTRRTQRLYNDLMQAVCKDRHRPVSYEVTRRAMAGLANLRFYNLGLKNTALNTQSESYRVLTGPRAERAVTAGDGRAYVQGHFFGSGAIGDERETVGASSSSRVWSNRSLTVSEYLDWISNINARLSGSESMANSQFDLIQHSKILDSLPQGVIAGAWNKIAYRHAPRIRVRQGDAAAWQYRQITDFEFASFDVSPDRKQLKFDLASDIATIPVQFRISGGPMFSLLDPTWHLEVHSRIDDWMDIATWLASNPPAFYGMDKSSFQGVNLMSTPSLTIAALAPQDIETLDWTGCAIDVELEKAKAKGQRTVHQQLERHLLAQKGLEALVYDHRTGEAADFIAVFVGDDGDCTLKLYHCKGAGGEPSGTRVGDVYEVAGQLLKSIAFCDPLILAKHVEHRMNAARHTSPSRFIVGDFAKLVALLQTPANKLHFEIYGVQPGLAQSQIDEHLADLMAFGVDYVLRGGAAKGGWIISP